MKNTDKIIIKIVESTLTHPLTIKDLMKKCNISPDGKDDVKKIVKKLTKDGILIRIKGNKYGAREKMGLINGTLQGHSDGYGFVIPEEGPDIFIKNRSMGDAMHGDTVVCRIDKKKNGNKKEGSIIRILKRGYSEVVGIYEKGKGNFGFVTTSEKRLFHDIFIPLESNVCAAKNGQVVLAIIEKYPHKGRNPEGKIIKIIGNPESPDVEIEVAIRKYGLSMEFPKDVLTEAEHLKKGISEKEIKDRVDLRKEFIVTIDGENAKDFDDAISLKRTESNTYLLGVHIADVSSYVKVNSNLDKEALKRGTSIYFPDRVVPMLPFTLSNNLCSLKPREDRLTLSAFMEIDDKGKLVSFKIAKSIIRSSLRLTYTEVARALELEDGTNNGKFKKSYDHLKLMEKLSNILKEKRLTEGSIDFDLPEPEIILDINGRPENIIKRERNVAHQIIEEFMLAANISVASYLRDSGISSLYRIHEIPNIEKIDSLNEFLINFGYTIKKSPEIHPGTFQKLLFDVKGKSEERLINTIILRTMKQAKYTVNNCGHFGLSFDCYTHFTSPIRRYPDLIVHRLLKECLTLGQNAASSSVYPKEKLEEITDSCSHMERKAEEAEREVLDIKRIQFMQDKEGKETAGCISGVTSFGFFVELEDYFVEGLVHVSSMADDYYIFQEDQYCLLGENTKKRFRLGDRVMVQINAVSVEKKEIDLLFVKKL